MGSVARHPQPTLRTPCPALSHGCVSLVAQSPGLQSVLDGQHFPGSDRTQGMDVLPSLWVGSMQKSRERLLTSPGQDWHEILGAQFLPGEEAVGSPSSAGTSPAAPGTPAPAAASAASRCSGMSSLRGHHQRGNTINRQNQPESSAGTQRFVSLPFQLPSARSRASSMGRECPFLATSTGSGTP